jgi:hypothetical protein
MKMKYLIAWSLGSALPVCGLDAFAANTFEA